mgnify:CR=1 FL=1
MGALFLLDQISLVDRYMLSKGTWEPDQIEQLTQLVEHFRRPQEWPQFLDIGAHGALYSILMVKRELVDQVWAFEPDPPNRAQLHANLFLNGLVDRIRVVDKAAGNQKGTISFFVAGDRNRGASGRTESKASKGRIDVEADTIDAMVGLKDAFVVAKIDVEGAELAVLEGMEKTIANNRCLFQIESFIDNFSTIQSWLVKRGFQYQNTIESDHYFYKKSI